MRKFDETVTFTKDEEVQYLTAFEISAEINLPAETTSLLEKEEIETSITFKQAQGSDLLVENNVNLGFVYVEIPSKRT